MMDVRIGTPEYEKQSFISDGDGAIDQVAYDGYSMFPRLRFRRVATSVCCFTLAFTLLHACTIVLYR